MAARIDVDDVDGLNFIEIVFNSQFGIGIDNTRVKTGAQNGGDTSFFAFFAALPLIIGVPGRRFANLVLLFMDGRIKIGGTRGDTGRHYRHVNKGRADIEDDFAAGFPDQGGRGINIGCIKCMARKNTVHIFQVLLGMDRVNDRLAFRSGA